MLYHRVRGDLRKGDWGKSVAVLLIFLVAFGATPAEAGEFVIEDSPHGLLHDGFEGFFALAFESERFDELHDLSDMARGEFAQDLVNADELMAVAGRQGVIGTDSRFQFIIFRHDFTLHDPVVKDCPTQEKIRAADFLCGQSGRVDAYRSRACPLRQSVTDAGGAR